MFMLPLNNLARKGLTELSMKMNPKEGYKVNVDMVLTYLSIPKLQRWYHWRLRIDKLFHSTL